MQLNQKLQTQAVAGKEFVIFRTFDAPRATVLKA